MPRTTTKKGKGRWAFGQKGKNRVWLYFSKRSGSLTLEWTESDGFRWSRRYRSLGHDDVERGREEAEDFAHKLRKGGGLRTGGIVTLGTLFDIYEREKLPSKGHSAVSHNKRAFKLFLRQWGEKRDVSTLSIREWDSYVKARRSGMLAPGGQGKPVRNRVIEQDLSLLMAVLNWATLAGDGEGGFLLERNPCKGFRKPREDNPSRPMFEEGCFDELAAPARVIDPRLALALILCNDTGHRLNSVRQIRWVDIDFEEKMIHWRADSDKMKREHKTPISCRTVAALIEERERQVRAGTAESHEGTGFVFPSPRTSNAPVDRSVFYRLWRRLRIAVPNAIPSGLGYHALRRKMASDLVLAPGAVVAAVGGWLDPKVAVSAYQRPSPQQMRDAIAQYRPA